MARKPASRRVRIKSPSLPQRLRGNFLTGLAVVLPVFLTIYIFWWLIGLVDARVVPLIPARYNPENIFGRNIFGLGLVVFIAFTAMIGALTKGIFGRWLIATGEGLVERMPVVRSFYTAVKQIVETMLNQSGNSFQQVCLVEYPRRGLWAIAFVSTSARGEIVAKTGGEELLSVFLPTTPNATTGFLRYVPKRDVVILDMTIEEAAKLIISAGLVSPAEKPEAPTGPPRGTPPASPPQRASAHQTSGIQPVQSP